ncbi:MULTISPECIES: dTDP-4-dehydrorhamnose reductase [unclassified Caballeronia]|uniref:dTDP-4-dehydrorhamnose reductase n=1 Tax=unclassified Caballeronia TaxID=2646786 RepID=UPI0028577A6B|nr:MULTISPECIES: dTDP-4-dehydrorhamnose reductase [unclassified Caballeronia]MDR5751452.1 dTDP-4-dehydrorhamnose reductase [Caballeronia sp. LZ024]MDR5844407.1 dTDP-4-dehydrorhamnose reductase [Caballeronia sp. LZ031]
MKVLLLGANGQVGWELARSLMPLGTVVALTREQADLAAPEKLGPLVDSMRPDIIVNAAAYTAVDEAEQAEPMALIINGQAVGELAAAARRLGALLVHYSTDYVFDGAIERAWREEDAPAPINAYGRSKLAGEQAIAASQCDHLVFRTTWVYAARGKNFLRTILRLAGEREELRVVSDQVGAPTSARLIGDLTAQCLAQVIKERRANVFASGLFHMTAAGSTSWHGFAASVIDYARATGKFPVATNRVIPIGTQDYPLPARRPANSRLDCSLFDQRFELVRPTWEVPMRQTIDQIIGA